jgi:intracellular septation protein A
MYGVDNQGRRSVERTPIRVAVGIILISAIVFGVALWLLTSDLGSVPWVVGLVLAVWGATGLLRGVGEVLNGVRRHD